MNRGRVLVCIFFLCGLFLQLQACSEDEKKAECGNGILEEGEQCDQDQLDGKGCTDFDYDGGQLACTDNCTFDESACTKCGNDELEAGEQCDTNQLGGNGCSDLNYDGGRLSCNDDCTFDESECYDCGGTDPCEGQTCSGHGTCLATDCVPYCECEAGFVPGIDLSCLEEGSCLQLGEECDQSTDCCFGFCLRYGVSMLQKGYCSLSGCSDDDDCENLSGDGRSMCCVTLYDYTHLNEPVCLKVDAGQTCGDRSGTCGSSCAGEYQSACSADHVCTGRGLLDPNGYCGSICTVDSDCNQCTDPEDPDMAFICGSFSGISFCIKSPPQCDSTQDCSGDNVCSIELVSDYLTEGRCKNLGDVETGGYCNQAAFQSDLPFDQRCVGGDCYTYHCTEACVADSDCPQGMSCLNTIFCTTPACNWVVAAYACRYLAGSQTSCTGDPDCPAGEVCTAYLTEDNQLEKVCVTRQCDPAEPDCLDVGEYIGDDLPECTTGIVGRYQNKNVCTAVCDTTADCPLGTFCGRWLLHNDFSLGGCMPIDGSGISCSGNQDCPDGETCDPYGVFGGEVDMFCTTEPCDPDGADCLATGEACDATSPPCWGGECFDGYCTEYCDTNADCPTGMFCGWRYFGMGTGKVGICAKIEGSGDPCGTDADCTQAGEVCRYFGSYEHGNQTLCSTPVGDKATGESCIDYSDCIHGVCLTDGIDDWCTTSCLADVDCPAGLVCGYAPYVELDGNNWPICWLLPGSGDSCTTNPDCATAGEMCAIFWTVDGTTEGRCRTEIAGGAAPGESCVEDGDCANRVCLMGNGLCTAYCATNADCLGYSMECSHISWDIYLDGFHYCPATGCIPPGADAPFCSICATDADCVGADAKCIASVANPGEMYCGKPCTVAGDCPTGTSCVDVGGGVSNCKPDTDTCIP